MGTRQQQSDIVFFASAISDSVFQSLLNAFTYPERADYWFAHADKLDSKFKTQYGHHYSYFLYPQVHSINT